MTAPLPFTAPALLAPMDGVTEPCFRDLVLERNPPETLGGAFTEFARVSSHPLPERVLLEHLGEPRGELGGAPVGLQLMGPEPEPIAETARRAEALGAALLDLNFGCPARGAVRSCAGSALLDHPERIEALVRATVEAVRSTPVTAKIRAGGEDDARLEEIAQAVEAGGACLLTVHCRTRREAYGDTADWERLRRAVGAVSIPVCGNGGVEVHADLARLLAETGCAYVMVGRAALADPWIFSGREVDAGEALRFLHAYAERLRGRGGATPRKAAGRVKQLVRTWRAGGLFEEAGERREEWLAEREPEALLKRLADLAEERAFPSVRNLGRTPACSTL